MLFYTGLFILVVAVSIDGLGVGISYGIQKTHVPFLAIFIIMLFSGFTVFAAMTVGDILERFITPTFSEMLGGLILILIGSMTFINTLRAKKTKQTSDETSSTLSNVKKVLSSPVEADLDQSGTISTKEAILLGFALALDAFGAGIAASFLHYDAFITATLIALMSGAFLFIGTKLGLFLSNQQKSTSISLIPPLLLISIGILNLL